jgi:hypothetical protein
MHNFHSTKHFTVLTQLPSSNEEEKSLIQYDSIVHCSSLSPVNRNDIHAHGTEIPVTQNGWVLWRIPVWLDEPPGISSCWCWWKCYIQSCYKLLNCSDIEQNATMKKTWRGMMTDCSTCKGKLLSHSLDSNASWIAWIWSQSMDIRCCDNSN